MDRAILIVNGRVESHLQVPGAGLGSVAPGYSLYLIDHRGQGLSGRMLADPEKGYVDQTSTIMWWISKQFHDEVIAADKPARLFLLAHSMGGAISACYLERWPDDIQAAVLSSP